MLVKIEIRMNGADQALQKDEHVQQLSASRTEIETLKKKIEDRGMECLKNGGRSSDASGYGSKYKREEAQSRSCCLKNRGLKSILGKVAQAQTRGKEDEGKRCKERIASARCFPRTSQ